MDCRGCSASARLPFTSPVISIVVRRYRGCRPFIGTPGLAECGPPSASCGRSAASTTTSKRRCAPRFQLDYPRYEIVCCVAHPQGSGGSAGRAADRGSSRTFPRACWSATNDRRQSEAEQRLQGLARRGTRLDRDGRQQRPDAARLPAAPARRPGAPIPASSASPPVGCRPDGFWAELECAFLNTYQARWQLTADSVGLGFAQGKIDALAAQACSTRPAAFARWRRAGRGCGHHQGGARRRLAGAPGRCAVRQPLGRRSRRVWQRQLRWARLRRASFKACYALEIFSGGVLPMVAAELARRQRICRRLPSRHSPARSGTAGRRCWHMRRAGICAAVAARVAVARPVAARSGSAAGSAMASSGVATRWIWRMRCCWKLAQRPI